MDDWTTVFSQIGDQPRTGWDEMMMVVMGTGPGRVRTRFEKHENDKKGRNPFGEETETTASEAVMDRSRPFDVCLALEM